MGGAGFLMSKKNKKGLHIYLTVSQDLKKMTDSIKKMFLIIMI